MKEITERFSKKIIVMGLVLVALIVFSVFSFSENTEDPEIISKPVEVIEVEANEEPTGLEYFGIVKSVSQKEVSFKMPGKLSSLSVEEGDMVSGGQTLASIENADLQRAAGASENSMEAAKNAYDFALDNYEKLLQLQEAGGISAQELDQAKLEMDSRKTTYENAKIDYDNRNAMIGDSVIRADFDGVVARIFYEKGEMVPAAYPVVLLQSQENKVEVGITQRDIQTITKNTKAYVIVDGQRYQASISNLSLLPDPATKTYAAELQIKDQIPHRMPLGSTLPVTFVTGSQKAVYLPLTMIANDGKDYVYVVNKEQQAEKRIIELGQVRNTEVQVFGLQDGERVISKGFGNINDGEQVKVNE